MDNSIDDGRRGARWARSEEGEYGNGGKYRVPIPQGGRKVVVGPLADGCHSERAKGELRNLSYLRR